ncbi:unnamed protein product, partial [Tilletia caries]
MADAADVAVPNANPPAAPPAFTPAQVELAQQLRENATAWLQEQAEHELTKNERHGALEMAYSILLTEDMGPKDALEAAVDQILTRRRLTEQMGVNLCPSSPATSRIGQPIKKGKRKRTANGKKEKKHSRKAKKKGKARQAAEGSEVIVSESGSSSSSSSSSDSDGASSSSDESDSDSDDSASSASASKRDDPVVQIALQQLHHFQRDSFANTTRRVKNMIKAIEKSGSSSKKKAKALSKLRRFDPAKFPKKQLEGMVSQQRADAIKRLQAALSASASQHPPQHHPMQSVAGGGQPRQPKPFRNKPGASSSQPKVTKACALCGSKQPYDVRRCRAQRLASNLQPTFALRDENSDLIQSVPTRQRGRVAWHSTNRGLHVEDYSNDILVLPGAEGGFNCGIEDVVRISTALGWPWERAKDAPWSAIFTYGGLTFSIATREVSLPERKRQKYLNTISEWEQRGSQHQLHDAQRFLGQLQHATTVYEQ